MVRLNPFYNVSKKLKEYKESLYTNYKIKMKLVVVESPAKCKKIKSYLGKGYDVTASFGHFRILANGPHYGISIDKEKQKVQCIYQNDKKKSKVIKQLKEKAQNSTEIIIATDDDREGEAIGFHIAHLLKLDPKKTKRMIFHEITPKAIQKAIQNTTTLDLHQYNAQQSRVALDRLIGYSISPLLWDIQRGLSAGRVQSVALQEMNTHQENIQSKMVIHEDTVTNVLQYSIHSLEENSTDILVKVQLPHDDKEYIMKHIYKTFHYVPESVQQSNTKPTSPIPFITSTLQQVASTRFKWSSKKTMQFAQELYEKGYITYHRTDQSQFSQDFIQSAQEFISQYTHHIELVQPKQKKNKTAQEAHEAIRPTTELKDMWIKSQELNPEPLKLYQLIFIHSLKCFVQNPVFKKIHIKSEPQFHHNVTLDLSIHPKDWNFAFEYTHPLTMGNEFITLSWVDKCIHNDNVIQQLTDEMNALDKRCIEWTQKLVHSLETSTYIPIVKIQNKTLPPHIPGLHKESDMIQWMEKSGIGRPSTYATIVDTLFRREYIQKGKLNLKWTIDMNECHDKMVRFEWTSAPLMEPPKVKKRIFSKSESDINKIIQNPVKVFSGIYITELGKNVNGYLQEHLQDLFCVELTKTMEDTLDKIAENKLNWNEYIIQTNDFLQEKCNTLKGSPKKENKESSPTFSGTVKTTIDQQKTYHLKECIEYTATLKQGKYGEFYHIDWKIPKHMLKNAVCTSNELPEQLIIKDSRSIKDIHGRSFTYEKCNGKYGEYFKLEYQKKKANVSVHKIKDIQHIDIETFFSDKKTSFKK